jgi:hypothetical protein
MSISCTDKKENKIFLIYKEIQKGSVAKSYMTNDLIIYGEIFAHFLIYSCARTLSKMFKYHLLFAPAYGSGTDGSCLIEAGEDLGDTPVGHQQLPAQRLQYRSGVHERTISLRFLGIILRVPRLKVSVYSVYITNQFQPTFLRWGWGGWGGGSKIRSRGDCE